MQNEKSQGLILGDLSESSITNQGLILGSLLESPKTTAELATELGYGNEDGPPSYKIIGRDLKKLKGNGFIDGRKEKLRKAGHMPTLYSIVINIQNLRLILEKYPRLMSKMQKNASVSEIYCLIIPTLFMVQMIVNIVAHLEKMEMKTGL